MSEELRRRLKEVDPNLKIVPGGRRRHYKTSKSDWDRAAGVNCSRCGREVYQSREGLCLPCWEKEHDIEIRDKAGILNLLPQSVIMSIVHPSRKG